MNGCKFIIEILDILPLRAIKCTFVTSELEVYDGLFMSDGSFHYDSYLEYDGERVYRSVFTPEEVAKGTVINSCYAPDGFQRGAPKEVNYLGHALVKILKEINKDELDESG